MWIAPGEDQSSARQDYNPDNTLVFNLIFTMISSDCTYRDGWTAKNRDHFTTIMAHGVSEMWEMRGFMIGFTYSSAAETAAYIAQGLQEAMREWGIRKEKVWVCLC